MDCIKVTRTVAIMSKVGLFWMTYQHG